MLNSGIRESQGISLFSVIMVFLFLFLLIPGFLAFDLLGKFLRIEETRITQEFFQEVKSSYAVAKQEMQENELKFSRLLQLVSQDLNPEKFGETVRFLASEPNVLGASIISTEGAILEEAGVPTPEIFKVEARSSRQPVFFNEEGQGLRVQTKWGDFFLALNFDREKERREFMEAWRRRIENQHGLGLLILSRENPQNEFQARNLVGDPGGIASAVNALPNLSTRIGKSPDPFTLSVGGSLWGFIPDPFTDSMAFVVFRRADIVRAKFGQFKRRIFLEIGTGTLIMVFLLFLFSSLFRAPLKTLTDACARIAEGDYSISVLPSPILELNVLGRTLARMANRVGSRIDGANRELMEQHRQLTALFESISDAVYFLEPELRVTFANPVALKHFAMDSLPAKGFPIGDIRGGIIRKMGEKDRGVTGVFHDEREKAFFQIVAARVTDHLGTTRGFVVVERDVTLEREIDRMKTELISNVSHELRTPLTSIQAYTEMLLDGEAASPEQGKEYLRIVYEETGRLTRLVNDILDLSRIESGRQVLRKTVVNPARLAAHCAEIMEKWAVKKKQTLVFEEDCNVERFEADRDLLEQATLNLLSNAVKYTPEGGKIILRCLRKDGEIIFEVADTGIGMSEVERSKLFSKFFRAENDTVREAGGTGLGLVLVQEIAKLHSGRVEVRSQPGAGSSFSLVFPLP